MRNPVGLACGGATGMESAWRRLSFFFFTVAVRPTILEFQQCPRDDGLVTLISVPEYTCYLTQWHTGYPFQVVPTRGC